MHRFAVFVDAGYILAAGGWAAIGTYKRHEMTVDYAALVGFLSDEAAAACPGLELLRLYWYDAAPNRQPTTDQLRIDHLPDTKVRLGRLTSRGEQKGVDGLILSDLTTLARERSIVTAVVVAGDGDLVEAVLQAQQHGVRVVLWGVRNAQNTVSPDLRREADRVRLLTGDELAPFFARVDAAAASRNGEIPASEPPREPATAPDHKAAGAVGAARVRRPAIGDTRPAQESEPLVLYASIPLDDAMSSGRAFGIQWASQVSDADRRVVEEERPRIPAELDIRLIHYGLEAADLAPVTRLAQETLWALRDGFWVGFDEVARRA